MQNFCWYCLKCVIFFSFCIKFYSLFYFLVVLLLLRSCFACFLSMLCKKNCVTAVLFRMNFNTKHTESLARNTVFQSSSCMHLTFNAILELGCHKAGLLYNTIIIHWLNKWKNTQYIDKSVYGYRIIRIQFQFSTHTWTGTDGVRRSLADMYGHNQAAVQAASACIIVVC